MVRRLVSRLEETLKNVPLLQRHPDKYHDANFNGKVALYFAANHRRIERAVMGYKENGDEDDKIIAAILAYVPQMQHLPPKRLDSRPSLVPHAQVDVQERLMRMVRKAPDGAITWDDTYVNDKDVIFGDVFGPATTRANKLTGLNEEYAREAIQPFIAEALPENHIGARTLKAVCVPLAIPGAISYVLKGTVYEHGVGKVMMFDGTGVRAEAYLEERSGVPKDMYLYPRQHIAIVRRDYRFDKNLRRTVLAHESIIDPKDVFDGYSKNHRNGKELYAKSTSRAAAGRD